MAVTNPNPLPWFIQKMVGAVARHLFTAIAGSLAASVGMTTDQKTQFIAGGASVVVFLFGVGWSYMEKKGQMEPNTVPGKVMADTSVATVVTKTPSAVADAKDAEDDDRLLGG